MRGKYQFIVTIVHDIKLKPKNRVISARWIVADRISETSGAMCFLAHALLLPALHRCSSAMLEKRA
jgi:hypothetical protein